jgi:hypothetical protein
MPRLTSADRAQIINTVAEHTHRLREDLRKDKNWNQLSRYIGLIGLRGALESPSFEPHQIAHVKKMAAIESFSVLEPKRRPRTAAQFWQEIEEQVGRERAEIKSHGITGRMSRKYEWAHKDLSKIHLLLANPLLIELRQTVRQVGEEGK